MLIWKMLENKIREAGGFVNAHAHFDRAHTLTPEDMESVVYNKLEQKWRLVDKLKRETTIAGYQKNIMRALNGQKKHGSTACLSFIDIDPVCGDRAILATSFARAISCSLELHKPINLIFCCSFAFAKTSTVCLISTLSSGQ